LNELSGNAAHKIEMEIIMRLGKGHSLKTLYNGARGAERTTVGVCSCGWYTAADTREMVREDYNWHLMDEQAELEKALEPKDPGFVQINANAQKLEHAANIDPMTYITSGVAIHGDTPFSMPMISHIMGGGTTAFGALYMGGCKDFVKLPEDFDLVISLYPWEKYTLGENTNRVEIKLYDAANMPDTTQLLQAAEIAYQAIRDGQKVLIHCQAGLNRSGLITALTMMKLGYDADAAIAVIRDQRSPACICNSTFENWLRTEGEQMVADHEIEKVA
jgi:protein-tyrosine phosphatase